MARRKVRFQGRFYIIVALFICLLMIALFLLLGPKETMRISAGSLEYTNRMNTIVIRNEKVTNAENWGKVTYIASESQTVNEGDVIAEVYKAGYNERVLQDLTAVQKEITEYVEGTLLKDVINQDLEQLKDEIDSMLQSISLVVRGEKEGDILLLEQNLIKKMQERQALLRSLVQSDETLDELLEKESDYQEKITAWKSDITADQTGMVSFYFDGCEAFFNAGEYRRAHEGRCPGFTEWNL